jgi:hypothetical protein
MSKYEDFAIHFKNYKEITLQDISEYFYVHGEMTDNNIAVLINRWINQGILSRIKKGIYVLTNEKKKSFTLLPDEIAMEIGKLFSEKYPELTYCVWNTDTLNNFATHQTFNPFYLFETEADVLENVFYLFKEHNFNVFLSPDEELINKYIVDSENPIIIKKIVSRAPLMQNESIPYPAIEKILVDIFVDKVIFHFLQGSELVTVYNEVFNNYAVNITKMLNYADRRKAKEDIVSFIRAEVNNPDIISLL